MKNVQFLYGAQIDSYDAYMMKFQIVFTILPCTGGHPASGFTFATFSSKIFFPLRIRRKMAARHPTPWGVPGIGGLGSPMTRNYNKKQAIRINYSLISK